MNQLSNNFHDVFSSSMKYCPLKNLFKDPEKMLISWSMINKYIKGKERNNNSFRIFKEILESLVDGIREWIFFHKKLIKD